MRGDLDESNCFCFDLIVIGVARIPEWCIIEGDDSDDEAVI